MIQSVSPSQIKREIVREKCSAHRGGLKEFIRLGWHILEPERRPFIDNWHIDVICEHLEAVTRGEIPLLVINVPPGTMKSLIVCVFWPAWEWGPANRPDIRYMSASYAQHLSTRDARKTRQLIESSWYQYHWGDLFTLREDQNAKTNFVNDKNGHRIATSVGGVGTGERGDRNLIDDPHNVLNTLAVSGNDLKIVRAWWDNVMPTRTNDSSSATVVVMQRVHQGDLTGVIEEQAKELDPVFLRIAMEYELNTATYTFLRPKKYKGPDKKKYRWDPRRKVGELLDPVRFPLKAVAKLKRRLGTFGTAGQLQQRPSPKEGGIIQIKWFQRYTTPPDRKAVLRRVQSWDSANKGGQQNAYSVCETWDETRRGKFLVDVQRFRTNIPELCRRAEAHARKMRPNAIIVEDHASGTTLIQHLREKIPNIPVFEMSPETDKVTRMDVETPVIEAGLCHIPADDENKPDWLDDWETEHKLFPNTVFKDQVDSTSQYLKWSREHGFTQDWDLY